MRQTRAQYFIELFHYWMGRLGLQNDVPTIRDNRYDCHACILQEDDGKATLKYNANRLAKWSKPYIIQGVLHEIGHYINNAPYNTEEEQVYEELSAEIFALTMMRCYYPKEYKDYIKEIRSKIRKPYFMKRQDNIHIAMLNMVREYM